MTEEATNGNNIGPPDIRTMGVISRAAFEVDDYWRIVEILHKRSLSFSRFDLIDTFFFIRSMAVNFFFLLFCCKFRLFKFDRKNWRDFYKALILLEHLLTHGPRRVAEEFQCDKDVIKEIANFQYIDERGLACIYRLLYLSIKFTD